MKSVRFILLVLFCLAAFGWLPTSHASGTKSVAPVVTFNKDIAPIFFKSCAECHRPGETAPFSVLSYKDVRPWAKSIREHVANRTMPPWHADPHFGQFQNDRRLSQKEIDTIVAWVANGAPEGNAKDLPPAPRFVEGWGIGTPDVIVSMKEPYTVEATGPDEYQYFEIDPGFTEDKYVRAVEARPGNRKVVHHIVVFVQPPSPDNNTPVLTQAELTARRTQQAKESIRYSDGFLRRTKADAPVHNDGCELPNGGGGSKYDTSQRDNVSLLLTEWAPGRNPDVWGAERAKKILAGSKLIFQVHYNKAAGLVQTDLSSIGLQFAKTPPAQPTRTELIFNGYMQIAPGAERERISACWTASSDVKLTALMPHMHVRGVAMQIEAVYPDGRKEMVLNVPRYDFAWQTGYALQQPLHLPKGTRLLVTGWFDNSAKNKYNPDPTKAVRWGDPTYDEMLACFIDYTVQSNTSVARDQ
jgi:mono/diheme cytochrome c family protein